MSISRTVVSSIIRSPKFVWANAASVVARMSAFLLHRSDSRVDLPSALKVMNRKGFRSPTTRDFGSWTMHHWGKQLRPSERVDAAGGRGAHVFAFGAPIVNGQTWAQGLQTLLAAAASQALGEVDVRGSYLIAYWSGERWQFRFDPAGSFHAFANEPGTAVSSSFLALLAAAPEPMPICRLTVLEKLAVGYTTPPATLVDGLIQLPSPAASPALAENGIDVPPHWGEPSWLTERSEATFEESCTAQASSIRSHMTSATQFGADQGVDLGLSGGYDSRMILAASEGLRPWMRVHTHGTQGVHESEAAISRTLAGIADVPIRVVETRRIDQLEGQEIEAMLLDGLYFYDARYSHNMGIMSQVYSRAYRASVHEGAGLALNGLGGEVYRNYYSTPPAPIRLRAWMERHVYYPYARAVIGDRSLFEEVHERKVSYIAKRVGRTPKRGYVSRRWLRAYYAGVRMTDGDATNGDALTQLVFYHMPFMEPALALAAVANDHHVGMAGAYQGRIIRELDSRLASVASRYGHPLDIVPMRVRVKEAVRYLTPHGLQANYVRRRIAGRRAASVAEFRVLSERVPLFGCIAELLRDTIVRGRLEDGLLHYAQGPMMLGIGAFLHEFQDKLRMPAS